MIEKDSIISIWEVFFLHGFSSLRLRHLGDRMMLLSRNEEHNLEEIIENKSWLERWFALFSPWQPQMVLGHRLVWIRVCGIPRSKLVE